MQRRSWKLGVGLVAVAGVAAGGLAGLAGCAGAPPRLVDASAPAPAAAKRDCGRWVVGVAAAVREQRLIVLAGGLGTEEAPRFAGELVCQLGARQPVVLAVPWPRQLASTINLALGGSAAAEAKLRASPLWSDAGVREGGLATRAMWQLMERLRAWRAAGLEVKVVPFGKDFPDPAQNGYVPDEDSERYYQISALEQALRRNPDAKVVLWLREQDGARQGAMTSDRRGRHTPLVAAAIQSSNLELVSFQLEAGVAVAGEATAGASAGATGGAAAGATGEAAAGAAASP